MLDEVNEATSSGETPSRLLRPEGQIELDKQLKLARIQLKIVRLQRAINRQPTQAAELGTSKAFKAYVQCEYGPKSEVGQYILAFHEKVKVIQKPALLTSTQTYLTWWENVLLAAKQADVDDILLEGQMEPPVEDEGIVKLWHMKNTWLHTFIWSTVSMQAQLRFKAPDEIVAYMLWNLLEGTFAEQPETVWKQLILEIFCLTPDFKNEHQYIEKILALWIEISHLGYPCHAMYVEWGLRASV